MPLLAVATKTVLTGTVSLITSDATWGRINARAQGPVATTLNVDARPVIEQDSKREPTNRIRLDLSVEYQPIRTSADDPFPPGARPTNLNQSLSIVLTSGVPIVVSQAADPLTDRQVIVEVKATVMK